MIYAGIDEAGYGPILGPLCVASTVFEIPDDAASDGCPDLWRSLSPLVCRSRSEASSSKIAVADSKALKLANSVKRQHPLHHLELGVLAFLNAREQDSRDAWTVGALLEALHAEAGGLPWYTPESDPSLPLGTTPDHLQLLSSRLRATCASASVRLAEARCSVACEQRFNSELRRCQTKAELSFRRVASLLHRVWKSDAALRDDPTTCPRVVVDRQGGRTRYAGSLARAVPEATVETVGEAPTRSVYELRTKDRRVRVSFEVEAETRHLPVALASMSAKLVRELLIARLNAFWSARCEELKPTAGYAQDGARFLRDLSGVATPDELRELRRNA
ncbi:MAG: hypothetical protein NXI14_00240 [bacterium]|nr:hypothetical protein [bacterium]